ncbi:DUF1206 domain-containing protein [Streptomyces sp. NPDC058964]|uniref:DUF1206 domain-containing protein n=1 Tax=Streptomyces sp. NPDC058964 TaxID=3346681 RepID=UPI0036759E03
MDAGVVARSAKVRSRRGTVGAVTRWSARAGLVARGAVYLLVGLLALGIAFGDRRKPADRSGAVAELSDQPFGGVLLWALGIGLFGMAVWRLSEALLGSVGPDGRKARMRLLAVGRCVFYAFFAWSVLSFATGSGGPRSSDQQSRDISARALGMPAGQWIVGAVGAGVVVTGVWIGVQAVRRVYPEELRTGEMSARARRFVDVTGVGGGLSRGAVFVAAGAFVVRAAVEYRPDRAKGIDDTLRSFAAAPAGPWLLAAVAAGLVLFGVFSCAAARWCRV